MPPAFRGIDIAVEYGYLNFLNWKVQVSNIGGLCPLIPYVPQEFSSSCIQPVFGVVSLTIGVLTPGVGLFQTV